MIRLLAATTFLAPLCLTSLPGADGGSVASFVSPGGRYEVRFEARVHRTFTKEEQLQALDNMNHIEYEVTFSRVDSGKVVVATPYVDVYGFNSSGKPTPVSSLFSWFEWSPEEDFVVVPAEGWASAPGTPENKVFALNDQLGWLESWLCMNHVTWVNPLLAVGDRHRDCDYSVDTFDGRTGKQQPVVQPDSPIGYQIAAASERQMLIRKVLDNCASAGVRQTFQEQCLSLDLDTMEVSPAPCPAAGQ